MAKIYPFIETGIYKFTNKITGETYIGQSKNLYDRYKSHIHKTDNPLDAAIRQYGIENFDYEILEYCFDYELDTKEEFYIKKFDSINNGYNRIHGGQHNIGESNGRVLISEKDVYDIREAYKNHKRQKDIYEKFKDKLSFEYFQNLWEGRSWTHIHMDVYTDENKIYYSREATNGELSPKSIFTNEEVIKLRERYVNESAKDIYESVKDKCKFQTFQQILWGRTYKDLPIYDKKNKKWIN